MKYLLKGDSTVLVIKKIKLTSIALLVSISGIMVAPAVVAESASLQMVSMDISQNRALTHEKTPLRSTATGDTAKNGCESQGDNQVSAINRQDAAMDNVYGDADYDE